MRAKSSSTELTVTERARRAQIVGAAIETVAEVDYAGASFKRIAAKAGLSSTGLISYHFAGKQELVDAVFREILATFGAFVLDQMDQSDQSDMVAGEVRAFLRANVEFIRRHPDHLRALLRLKPHVSVDDGGIADSDQRQLAELLGQGQRRGEFREFDAGLMAVFILALRNGVVAKADELDLDACERELVAMVESAITRG